MREATTGRKVKLRIQKAGEGGVGGRLGSSSSTNTRHRRKERNTPKRLNFQSRPLTKNWLRQRIFRAWHCMYDSVTVDTQHCTFVKAHRTQTPSVGPLVKYGLCSPSAVTDVSLWQGEVHMKEAGDRGSVSGVCASHSIWL